MKKIKVDKVILYYMDRVDPDGNLYRFYVYKGMASEIEYFCFEKLDLDAGDATWLHQSCCCDHCVNHLGIDLCDCGSEHKVGECECGSQKAHDTLGIKYDSFEAILKNFG